MRRAATNQGQTNTNRWIAMALLAASLGCAVAAGCSPKDSPEAAQPAGASASAPDSSELQTSIAPAQTRELTPEAKALIHDIDSTLEQDYEKLYVVILLGMQGEIMPCGCSDGVRGGLIKFASLAAKAKAEQTPSVFVSLGGNHFRAMKPEQYTPFAKYYNERLSYVDKAIDALGPSLKILAPNEREFIGTLPAMKVTERHEAKVTLPSGTTVLLQGASPPENRSPERFANANEPQATQSDAEERRVDLPDEDDGATRKVADPTDWIVRFASQETGQTEPNGTRAATVAFGGTGTISATEGETGRVAVLPPPEFGGRDLAHLTLYIPANRSPERQRREDAHRAVEDAANETGQTNGQPAENPQSIRSIGEVRAYKSIIQRSGDKESDLINSIRKRWERLRDDAPVLYEYQRTVVKLTTPDDPKQLEMYFQFQNSEQTQLGDIETLASGDDYVSTCEPCHAEVVANFKKHDKHFIAMDILRKQGKDKDRFCVTCHITPKFQGGKEAMGYKLYEGVQCEMCHVNAQAHAQRPNLIKPFAVSEAVCVTCHTATQHPEFNFKAHAGKVCCNIGKEDK